MKTVITVLEMADLTRISHIVAKSAMSFPEWRLIRKFCALEWSAFYRIALIEKQHIVNGTIYELYLVLFPSSYDSSDDNANCILIRDYRNKVKAVRAYRLLTNVNYY